MGPGILPHAVVNKRPWLKQVEGKSQHESLSSDLCIHAMSCSCLISHMDMHTQKKKFFFIPKKKNDEGLGQYLSGIIPASHSCGPLQKKVKRGWACTGMSLTLREMTQYSRILDALAKDQDLTARIHIVAHSYLQLLSQEIWFHLLTSTGTRHMFMW